MCVLVAYRSFSFFLFQYNQQFYKSSFYPKYWSKNQSHIKKFWYCVRMEENNIDWYLKNSISIIVIQNKSKWMLHLPKLITDLKSWAWSSLRTLQCIRQGTSINKLIVIAVTDCGRYLPIFVFISRLLWQCQRTFSMPIKPLLTGLN